MKKIIAVITTAAVSMQLYAQSVDEGIKMYQYEKFETAKNILSSHAEKNDEANYYLGLSYIGLHDLNKANEVFSKNDHYYNLAGKARILYLQGKPEEAQTLLEGIVDKAKKREWEKLSVAADAITYTEGGNVALALSWYMSALERQTKNADLYISLGDAYMKLASGGGNAMTNYEKAVELGGSNSLAYSRIGRLWYVAQQYPDALNAYNQAKEADPENPLPYRDLAKAYQKAGNYKYALENIEEYLAKSDKSVDDKIEHANILYEAGEYATAKEKMEELIAQGHVRPYMYRIVAYTSFEEGDVKAAERNLNLFFEKSSENEYINNDYIYAAKIYTKLANELKSEAQANVEEGEEVTVSSEEQEYRDKVDNYLSKIELENDNQKADIYKELADFFKDEKEYAKAAAYYKNIVELEEREAQVLDYYWWGVWNFYAQNLDESLEAFEKMSEKFPDEGSALYWQARVKAAKDPEAKGKEAMESYKKWLAFENENYTHSEQELMTAYQYVTFYYYNHDDKANALKYANKVKELDSENSFANQIINYFQQQ